MFDGGIYHGKILLPKNFPFRAPHIQLITKSGRFETMRNICIDGYTAWHNDTWNPKSFSQIIRALQSLFNDMNETGIGYDFSVNESEVKGYRESSRTFKCPACEMDHSTLDFGE